MERFKAAHVTASKELKKRKGFRNKIKNLLSAKTSKNEFSARGKLEPSELGVVPVDPKRLKKNRNVEFQFITDVTSKILELAETVPPPDDKSNREGTVPVSLPLEIDSEPEIIAELKDDMNKTSTPLQVYSGEKSDVSNMIDTCQNESEKPDENSVSKSHGEKIRKRKEKRRKSKVMEQNKNEQKGQGSNVEEMDNVATDFEINTENDSFINVSTPSINDFASDSAELTSLPVHKKQTDFKVQENSAASLSLVSDTIEACQNESENQDRNIASKSNVERIKNRKEKKRKSKITEFNISEHTVTSPDVRKMNDVSSHCEKSNENDNFINVSVPTGNVFAFGSADLVSLPVHGFHPEQCVPPSEDQANSTGMCDIKPLKVRSKGNNSMKDFIATRLQSVHRNGKGETDYVAKMTQNIKEVLCAREPIFNLKSGDVTSTLNEKPFRPNMPHAFVRERFESLSIEDNSDCDVSFLRDVFHTHSKTQSVLSTSGDVDALQPQIDIRCVENDRVLLILKSGDSVYVRGKLTVSVIVGCAEVLGYKLKPGNEAEKYTIFSPRGVSLLSITACASINMFANDNELQLVCAHTQLPSNLIDSLGESDCVLLLEKAESNIVDYLSLHLPNKLFPNISSVAKGKKKYSLAERKLDCQLLPENSEENVKLFCKRDDWDSLSDAILSQDFMKETNCTVICGGKGVGKSTLLRFLINRSLSSHNKILCLDFDLGQAEFTVPGCISAVIIKKPLLGPNFTHLLQPERMVFIGDVNVSNCVTQYLEGAKFIIDYCRSQADFQHIPWFVNTMGFCKGLGVELMMNLLHMLSPTNVIQLQSRLNKRNYPKHLDAEYVRNYKSSLKYTSYINRNLYYDLHLIPSAAESKAEGQDAEWGLDSRTMREIVVMSYLSGMTAPPNYSLTELVPYVCGFKDLKLCVSHEIINPNSILSVMNGSFVALCICDKGEMLQPSDPNLPCIMLHAPVCQCLGFGIIRGVDMEDRQLYVISPLPEDEIQKVNCLVMGTVQLPSSVVLREATCGTVGHVPYTVIGPGQPTGRLSQKSSYHLLLSSAVEL